jgi:hypothetical protein
MHLCVSFLFLFFLRLCERAGERGGGRAGVNTRARVRTRVSIHGHEHKYIWVLGLGLNFNLLSVNQTTTNPKQLKIRES